MSAIANTLTRRSSELQTAAGARALCMVVRSKMWKPRPGNILSNVVVMPRQEPVPEQNPGQEQEHGESYSWGVYATPCAPHEVLQLVGEECKKYGTIELSPEYQLAFVPADADFSSCTSKLPIDHNYAKAVVSLGQALYATLTLYRSWGDQITQYVSRIL